MLEIAKQVFNSMFNSFSYSKVDNEAALKWYLLLLQRALSKLVKVMKNTSKRNQTDLLCVGCCHCRKGDRGVYESLLPQ